MSDVSSAGVIFLTVADDLGAGLIDSDEGVVDLLGSLVLVFVFVEVGDGFWLVELDVTVEVVDDKWSGEVFLDGVCRLGN